MIPILMMEFPFPVLRNGLMTDRTEAVLLPPD
jgi:hypothetical protein